MARPVKTIEDFLKAAQEAVDKKDRAGYLNWMRLASRANFGRAVAVMIENIETFKQDATKAELLFPVASFLGEQLVDALEAKSLGAEIVIDPAVLRQGLLLVTGILTSGSRKADSILFRAHGALSQLSL